MIVGRTDQVSIPVDEDSWGAIERPEDRSMEPADRKRNILSLYLIGVMLLMLVLQWLWAGYSRIETIPYSQFEQLLKDGKVAEVTVGTDSIHGVLKEPLPSGRRAFYTVRVDPQLADKLAAHDVVVTGAPSGGMLATRAVLAPAGLRLLRHLDVHVSAAWPSARGSAA